MARMDAKLKSKVIAALMAGEAVTTVANAYNVDKATVSRIKSGFSSTERQQITTEKRQTLAELIESAFVACVSAEMKIAEDFQDAAYRESLSFKERLEMGEYLNKRSQSLIETANKMLGAPPERERNGIPELPAADLASDVDIQAETFEADSEGVG